MAGFSTDYSGAWNNVKFDPGAYSSGLGSGIDWSRNQSFQMPETGLSASDLYSGKYDFFGSGKDKQQSWVDTGWGKGVIGASKFLKNYFDQNPNLSNRYSGGDSYGRGNVPWGTPPNVASSWSQLGSTFKDLGDGTSVETYPTSHQIGYQPGTPGRPGWGSTALGIAGGLASAIFPMAAPVIAPLTGALSSGMSAFNI